DRLDGQQEIFRALLGLPRRFRRGRAGCEASDAHQRRVSFPGTAIRKKRFAAAGRAWRGAIRRAATWVAAAGTSFDRAPRDRGAAPSGGIVTRPWLLWLWALHVRVDGEKSRL